jgi:Flp pilus assembly CpaE family ATPase
MSVYLLRSKTVTREATPVERELLSAIPNLMEATSLESIVNQSNPKRDGSTIILVTTPPDDNSYFDHLVDVAARYRNEIFLILISDEISASDYKRLVRSGAADWASAKAGSREVVEIIARRQQITGRDTVLPQAAIKQPITIAFVPSAGGVGNATLVVEVAAYQKSNKATRDRKVCIIDLDFQNSHICDYLDIEPRLRIEEISNAPERLDDQLFELFRTHHASGIDVIAAPRTKFASENLNIDALDALFNMIAIRYDLILIDLPAVWFGWTPQVIAASDAIIITGVNTIPCLRQISETLNLIRTSISPTVQVGIVLNKSERTLLGGIARRQHVKKVLEDEQIFFLGQRAEAIESANMGVPMMLGPAAGKIQKEIAGLAEFCATVKSTRTVSS